MSDHKTQTWTDLLRQVPMTYQPSFLLDRLADTLPELTPEQRAAAAAEGKRWTHGGNELARRLIGHVVADVDTIDGWITLTLDDGAKVTITAEYGASLELSVLVTTDTERRPHEDRRRRLDTLGDGARATPWDHRDLCGHCAQAGRTSRLERAARRAALLDCAEDGVAGAPLGPEAPAGDQRRAFWRTVEAEAQMTWWSALLIFLSGMSAGFGVSEVVFSKRIQR